VFKNIAPNFFETAGLNFYWRKQVSSSPLQNPDQVRPVFIG